MSKRIFTVNLILLLGVFVLAAFSSCIGQDEHVEKEESRELLNQLYDFSVPRETEIIGELEPEISGPTIMYFHQLLNEVDEDTFFSLREQTIKILSDGDIDLIPDEFSKDKLSSISTSNEAILKKCQGIDNLLIYEIDISGITVSFKYLKDEERLFTEIKEVTD